VIYELLESGRQVLIEGLQWWFAESPIADPFRWSADAEKTKLWIRDQYAEATTERPLVVVTSIVGAGQELAVNQAGEYALDDSGKVTGRMFHGMFTADFRMTVYANGQRDRDKVADVLIYGMVRNVREWIHVRTGANMMMERPFFQVVGEGQRQVTDRESEHWVTVGCRFLMSWHDEVPLEEEVKGMALTISPVA